MNISKHITYAEATFSNTAKEKKIDNNANEIQLANMKLVANEVFEKVREHFGVPIKINSFFRSVKLNSAVGGSNTSDHMKGMAIDMDAIEGTGVTNKMIYDYILANCTFTQLISEYGTVNNPAWVHVSYDKNNLKKQVLRIS